MKEKPYVLSYDERINCMLKPEQWFGSPRRIIQNFGVGRRPFSPHRKLA